MTQRLRVLSLATLFPAPPRPAFGKFVAAQMAAVVARGDVDLVVINPIGFPPGPLARREPYSTLASCPLQSRCDDVVVHHPRFTTLPVIGSDLNPARIVRAVLPLARKLHAEAPFDLVDAQFFFPDGPAAMRIAGSLGLPFTVKARGSDIHYWGGRRLARGQIRKTGAAAARMLAVSAALAGDMADLGLPADRIAVHYTGLDRERFRPLARRKARAAMTARFDLPARKPLFVTPGALIPIKGQRLAIEALALLPDTHLALAGSGADEAALHALVARLGLGERVHFLGQVPHDQLAPLLAGADAVVLPSEREGLANVWIEALACGTPLVIPDIGGAREVVTSPTAGRIAARDPEAVAAALRDILAAPPAPAAVARQVAGFSWEANAEKLVDIWREAAAR